MGEKAKDSKADKASGERRYKAPALAKGLDILELLSGETEPLTLSGISERMNRSRSEIFRMVLELEMCGYLQRGKSGEGFELTNKLFLLGMERPATKTLVEAALPIMRDFTMTSGQSCHIGVPVDEYMVVIARIEARGPIGFAVRVGHRGLLSRATSGLVLLAFQPDQIQQNWFERLLDADPETDMDKLNKILVKIKKGGMLKSSSQFVRGVTDLSAPIMVGGRAIAALTAPCMIRSDRSETEQVPIDMIKTAAQQISMQLAHD